ncbi:Alkanal monooxygenase alpha chain [Thalassocella blandensis]|nr:Alkanal monooxygenase alpha chain [Thalassocella blandensis]
MSLLADIPFSLLDLVSVPEGSDAGKTLKHTMQYARAADTLGYTRFWMAEHHNMEGVASSATAVLIGHIAGGTENIRVGAGGIMLPNHPPLVVAEQFGTLASLYPGRIDLGLGRAPGTDPVTARALRRDQQAAEDFATEVSILGKLFEPAAPGQRLQAVPGCGLEVPIWILGSSLYSAELAAAKGLPYAFAGHFAPRMMRAAAALYRRQFRPSATLTNPHFMLGLPLVIAQTEARAQKLMTTPQQRVLALLRGQPLWLRPPVESMAGRWSIDEEAGVNEFLSLAAMGAPEQVQRHLEQLAEECEVDEFIFTNDVYDPADRIEALHLLMSIRE